MILERKAGRLLVKAYETRAEMGRAAAADPTLLRIASTRSVTIGGRTLTNHNKLLSYRADCVGLKTGYTRAAGRTLVSCAERDGQRLIAVTLQDGNDWADHSALFDYGFSAYPAKTVVARGEILGYARAEGQDIPLRAGASFRWPTSAEETVTVKASFPETLADAPLGAEVGEAVITCRGKVADGLRFTPDSVLRGLIAAERPSLPQPEMEQLSLFA